MMIGIIFFTFKYTGYRGRLLEWCLNVAQSILILVSNIFVLIYMVIAVFFSPQNDIRKVCNYINDKSARSL